MSVLLALQGAGGLSVSVGLINQAPQTFTPRVDQAATPGLITQTAVAFAPVVQQAVAPGLITQTAVTFAPIRIDLIVAPGIVTRTPEPFAPILQVGNVNVSPAVITQTAVIFAPSLTVGAVSVTVTLINQVAQPFAPQVNQAVTVAAVIAHPATAIEPEQINVEPLFPPEIQTDTIFNHATTYAPTVVPGNVNRDFPLITQFTVVYPFDGIRPEDIFAPQINLAVHPGVIAQTPVVFAPSVNPGNVDRLFPLISQTAVLFIFDGIRPEEIFPPAIYQEAAPGLIAQTPVIYPPQVLAGAVEVLLELISSTAQVFAPSVEPAVTTGLITSTAQAFAPSVELSVITEAISQVAQVFTPLVQSDQQFIYPDLISQEPVLFAPTVSLESEGISGGPGNFRVETSLPLPLAKSLNIPAIRLRPRIFAPGLAQEFGPEDELEELLLLLS